MNREPTAATLAQVAELARLARMREPEGVEDCVACSGTGEGRSEYTRCAVCRGRGWLVTQIDEEEP